MSQNKAIKFLTTGGEDPFLPVLLDAINHAMDTFHFVITETDSSASLILYYWLTVKLT